MTLSGLGGVQEFGCATKSRTVPPHQRTARVGSSGCPWWHGGLMEASRACTASPIWCVTQWRARCPVPIASEQCGDSPYSRVRMRPHRSHRSTFGSHLSWRDQISKWKLDRPCESRRRNRPQKAARTARGFTAEAFETHADTLPLGSVQIEQERASNLIPPRQVGAERGPVQAVRPHAHPRVLRVAALLGCYWNRRRALH